MQLGPWPAEPVAPWCDTAKTGRREQNGCKQQAGSTQSAAPQAGLPEPPSNPVMCSNEVALQDVQSRCMLVAHLLHQLNGQQVPRKPPLAGANALHGLRNVRGSTINCREGEEHRQDRGTAVDGARGHMACTSPQDLTPLHQVLVQCNLMHLHSIDGACGQGHSQ